MTRRAQKIESLYAKRVIVLGLARQGTALVRFLAREGASVIGSDLRDAYALQETLALLRDVRANYVLGEHPFSMLDGVDLVCVSGGVPIDVPIVLEARRRGIPLSNDAQLFLERCPAPVVGITGSSGKTTTTTLVGRALQRSGFLTWVGGNIGRPLVDRLGAISETDRVVVELSSFQLELMTVCPDVAVVLNVTPNHLDRHKTMAAYSAAKKRILDYQGTSDVAVLNKDDAGSRSLARAVHGQLATFGLENLDNAVPSKDASTTATCAYLKDETLIVRLEGQEYRICEKDEIKLLGKHNVSNVMAASVSAAIAGAAVPVIREVVTSFTGVEHRLQLVRTLYGVRYYDDSIATSPERSIAAMEVFRDPIVLLAGGRDKALQWDEMARVSVERARYVVAFGEAADLVEKEIEKARSKAVATKLDGIIKAATLEEAVGAATRIARPGDVVLLAPGGTSFDEFRDFAQRGDRYQALVRAL